MAANKMLSAVADAPRFSLLKALSKGGRCACELPALVKKSQPAVSQHLSVLRQAGLVAFRREGAKRMYSLTPNGKRVLDDVCKW